MEELYENVFFCMAILYTIMLGREASVCQDWEMKLLITNDHVLNQISFRKGSNRKT